mmetsp:Transcript_33310/g.97079  ORF Transcript_33310/g.97079 Transcript_33310/m.97079 type:complete len:89 (+) Transcript_33310:107-373(+)
MQSTLLNQVARNLLLVFQTLFVIFFVGVSYMSLESMASGQAPGSQEVPAKLTPEDVCARRTWLVLPIVFVCGGVVNIDGFASTAALML